MEGEGIQVAVKVVKTEAEEMQRVKLLQEAAIMGQFSHPNVVRLNGVVTVGDPVSGTLAELLLEYNYSCMLQLNLSLCSQTMIVLEYMPQGDLKSYLERMRPQ